MGKKRNDWNTKVKKRQEKEDNIFLSIFRVMKHFFSRLDEWINEIEDPRNTSYITYTQEDLLILGILKNICSVESMRSLDENLNEEICIQNFARITGHHELEEIPHYDTLNNYLERLSPSALSDVRSRMIRALLGSRNFDSNRLLGKYWRVILDGTGISYFKERHCENCLTQSYEKADGTKGIRYFHKVLEAKLVLSENIVISLDTEFIENEKEDVTKQDCEINAAKRLMERLKANYPRLRMCIQGDALYAAESIMEICATNKWKYLFTHKRERQKLIDECYELLDDNIDKTKVYNVGKEQGTGYFYNHVEVLAGKEQVMNILEYRYKKNEEQDTSREYTMMWITNINLTSARTEQMIDAGRGRWKIENEGFNTQKNILYKIQHLNSRNSNAMKNHYLLTQISDIIMQLYLAWDTAHSTVKKKVQNIAAWILENFRTHVITENDMYWINKKTSIYLT